MGEAYFKMQNKKAAMEMSVGTIVTIVLLMSVLVLGIFLIQNIFKSARNAIIGVDAQIQSEINKLFANEEKSLVIYPSARVITVEKGKEGFGFAFSIKNEDGLNSQIYTYNVSAYSVDNCGTLTLEQANAQISGSSGTLEIQRGGILENARMVRFSFPKTFPSCEIGYELRIKGDKSQIGSADVWINVK